MYVVTQNDQDGDALAQHGSPFLQHWPLLAIAVLRTGVFEELVATDP